MGIDREKTVKRTRLIGMHRNIGPKRKEKEKRKEENYFQGQLSTLDIDVTVFSLLTSSSNRNFSVARGSIAIHVDKNTKSTSNKPATIVSK